MATSYTAGDYRYDHVEGWGKLPEGWKWGQVGAVGVDSHDDVHVFTRTEQPYVVFDKAGNFKYSWGGQIFEDAHGICMVPDDSVFLVDRDPELVLKFTKEGRHLLSLGKRHQASDTGWTDESRKVTKPGGPFHYPTDVSLAADGGFYVSDGYRNCQVHKYSKDGKLEFSWGQPGNGQGQFVLVHSVWEHKGRVYVADRQNNRIQIFSPRGEYQETWDGYVQPCKLYVDKDDIMYVAELGHRVTINDLKGKVLGRWGGEKDFAPGKFVAPHGLWVDSEGSIYVSEVLDGQRVQKFARVR